MTESNFVLLSASWELDLLGRFRREDEAAMKLIWLQLREVTRNWKMPARELHAAQAQFALLFGAWFEMHQ